jgi:hypothetical protein
MLGLTWEEFLARQSGRYYESQIEIATKKFKERYPEKFKCNTSGVKGFDKWIEENS